MTLPEKLILQQGAALRIDWDDAKCQLGWKYKRDDPPRLPGKIKSIGFLIDVNKEAITISTSIGQNRASLDDLSIPIGCVTNVEVLPYDYSYDGKELKHEEGVTVIAGTATIGAGSV